jgi:hypothetical protein
MPALEAPVQHRRGERRSRIVGGRSTEGLEGERKREDKERRKSQDKERGSPSAIGRTSGFFAGGGEKRTERGFELAKGS